LTNSDAGFERIIFFSFPAFFFYFSTCIKLPNMKKVFSLFLVLSLSAIMLPIVAQTSQYPFPFWNPSLSLDERVNDLVSRMTLQEKADQLLYTAPAIPRLGVFLLIPGGMKLCMVLQEQVMPLCFLNQLPIANSWDESLLCSSVANAISDEARAKYHEFQRRGKTGIYQGLTFWSPNINIFRDPRWGRGHETYGEDPYLTGRMGYEFVRGMQGDDPKYLKTVATAKHYAVHSGPEPLRHSFNAKVSEVDLQGDISACIPHTCCGCRSIFGYGSL
jgi:beta-glucosidase